MRLFVLVDELGKKIGVRATVDNVTYDYYNYQGALSYGFPARVGKLVVVFDGYLWKTKEQLGVFDQHHLTIYDSTLYNLIQMWNTNRKFKNGITVIYNGQRVIVTDYDFDNGKLLVQAGNGQNYQIPMFGVTHV